MTAQTLTRRLRDRRRLRLGDDHHTPGAERRPAYETPGDHGRDASAPAAAVDERLAVAPQPETEWSAHRMASVLCLLSAFASEEPVHAVDQGQAMQDIFAARLMDNPAGAERWTVNATGRDLLAQYGLDRPILHAVRRLGDSEAAGAV